MSRFFDPSRVADRIIATQPELITIAVTPCVYSIDDDCLEPDEIESIRSRLESGSEWAWCNVTVTIELDLFLQSTSLDGCSYSSEEEFRSKDLKSMLESLLIEIHEDFRSIESLLYPYS